MAISHERNECQALCAYWYVGGGWVPRYVDRGDVVAERNRGHGDLVQQLTE